jgi:hypothetical protein
VLPALPDYLPLSTENIPAFCERENWLVRTPGSKILGRLDLGGVCCWDYWQSGFKKPTLSGELGTDLDVRRIKL